MPFAPGFTAKLLKLIGCGHRFIQKLLILLINIPIHTRINISGSLRNLIVIAKTLGILILNLLIPEHRFLFLQI